MSPQPGPVSSGRPETPEQRPYLVGLIALLFLLPGCFDAPEEEEKRTAPTTIDARPPFSPDAPIGTTRLFDRVEDPGYPEGIAVDGDRLYVSSVAFADSGIVLEYNLTTGAHLRTFTFAPPPEPRGWERGALGMTLDSQGRLYVAELIGARIVRADPGHEGWNETTYVELPDLPSCTESPLPPCAPTRAAQPPVPNQPVFGPDDALYVTDTYQHTIWRIPPGGAAAEIWYQDPRFETAEFGMNGLAFGPRDDHLYITQSIIGVAAGGQTAPAGSAVWRLPFMEDPTPAELELFHEYPGVLIDGIAFGDSGRLYVTVLGVPTGSHGISVLTPDGAEERFFPTADENQAQEVPYNGPASIAFHDEHRSILVTNLAQSDEEHWAVLEAFVDDIALPLHRPELPAGAP